MNDSTYLANIRALLQKYTAKEIQESIHQLINEIKYHSYEDLGLVWDFRMLQEKVLGNRPSKFPITRSNLMDYVNEGLFQTTLNLTEEQSKVREERIKYVLIHVLDKNMGSQELDQLTSKMVRGQFDDNIKTNGHEIFKDGDAYRVIVNHLDLRTPSKKEHITSILMVLGFRIDKLDDYLLHKRKTPLRVPKDYSPTPIKAKKVILAIITSVVFLVILVLTYIYWDDSVQRPLAPGRPTIAGSDLFSGSYPVPDKLTNTYESIILKTDTILYESHLSEQTKIPSNEMWIKLWLNNLSEDQSVFAHSLLIKTETQVVNAGNIENLNVKVQQVKSTLEAVLKCSDNTTYEWLIQQNQPTLRAKERKYFWLHVSSNQGQCMLPFRIYLRVNSNEQQIIEADQVFHIGFSE